MNSIPVNHVHICEDVELVYKSKLIELQKVASLSCHVISLLQEKEKELLKQSNQIKMLEQQLSECKVVDQNLSGKGGKSKTIEADSGICSTKSFSTLNSLLSSVVEDGDGVLTPRAPHINNPAPTKMNRNQNFQPTADDLSVKDRHLPENSIPRESILQKVQQNVNDNRVLTSMSEFWAFTSSTSDQNFTSVVRELKKTKTLLSVKLHDSDTKIDDAMVSTNIKETMKSLESENEKLKAQIKELHMFKSMVRKEQEGVSVFLSHEPSQASAGTRKSESFDLQNDQHQAVSPISSCSAKQGNKSVEHKVHKREHNQGQKKQEYSSARHGEKSMEHEIHKNEHNQGQKNEEYTQSNVNLGHMQKEKQLQDEINTLKVTCEKLSQENQVLIRKNKKLMSDYEAVLHSMQTVEQQCEEKYTTDTLKHKKQQDEFKKQQEQYKKQLEEYRKQLEECRKQLQERRKQLEENKKQQEETESCNKDLLIHVDELTEKLEQEKSRKLEKELLIEREKQQHLFNLKDQDQHPLEDRKHLPFPHYYPSPPPQSSHGSSSHSSSSAVFNQVTRQPAESTFVHSDRGYQTPITKYECERCLLEFTDKMEHLEHLNKCLD